jgi:hypothetical protein
LEKELSVCRSIQKISSFGLGAFKLGAHAGKPSAAVVGVIACDDEKGPRLQLLAERFGAPPRDTMPSILPGMDLIDASPHDRDEFKDQALNTFFALAESDREKVFKTLRTGPSGRNTI